MIKHTLTQEDLDNNPELAEKGLKVGDKVEINASNIGGGQAPPPPPPPSHP